jgi:glycosyltransferase involved in cell wall biosynthesis
MAMHHPYRSIILPVPEDMTRPMWSVMIPSYNCANYLRETLTSVLAQDLGPEMMQIEVVDDHSTEDDPEAVVDEVGRGRVGFFRQPVNVGYINNFTTCLQRSRGKLIHLLHGDDVVLRGFYEKLQILFHESSDIGAAFCRVIYMNEQGRWQTVAPLEQSESGFFNNALEKIIIDNPIQVASIVVKRDVYENLGGFDQRFNCSCEDWEMWSRITLHYSIGYEVGPLAAYRCNANRSLTKTFVPSGAYARDTRKALQIISSHLSDHLPQEMAVKLIYLARDSIAMDIFSLAADMLVIGNKKAAMTQLREALSCSHSFKVFKKMALIVVKSMGSKIKKFYHKSETDVNEWVETALRWEPELPFLREVVFPYLLNSSCVCEIGPGTGRYARHIIPRITRGAVHIFADSPWSQNFTREYFAAYPNIIVHSYNGKTINMTSDSVDVVFLNGSFVELELCTIRLYLHQFERILKRKGCVIFDYMIISSSEGQRHIESHSAKPNNYFTCHYGNAIDELFSNAGFTFKKHYQDSKRTYVVYEKNIK